MYKIEKRLEKAVTRKEIIENDIGTKERIIIKNKMRIENLIKARYVLAEVAKLTQETFQDKVEKLITLAIRSVFDRDFSFKLHLERKRNKLECRPMIIENEHEYSPEDDMGGGLIDIVSFAWKVILWSMEKPRSRNVIVLDEPMKNMGDLVILGAKMLKQIAEKMAFQLIVITHIKELAEFAETLHNFEHRNGMTFVRPSTTAMINEPVQRVLKKRKA